MPVNKDQHVQDGSPCMAWHGMLCKCAKLPRKDTGGGSQMCSCVQTYICAPLSIIGPPDGHRGPFNQVMVRQTHLYSLPHRAPPTPPLQHHPLRPPKTLPLLAHIAMQLVLIGILCISILPSPSREGIIKSYYSGIHTPCWTLYSQRWHIYYQDVKLIVKHCSDFPMVEVIYWPGEWISQLLSQK